MTPTQQQYDEYFKSLAGQKLTLQQLKALGFMVGGKDANMLGRNVGDRFYDPNAGQESSAYGSSWGMVQADPNAAWTVDTANGFGQDENGNVYKTLTAADVAATGATSQSGSFGLGNGTYGRYNYGLTANDDGTYTLGEGAFQQLDNHQVGGTLFDRYAPALALAAITYGAMSGVGTAGAGGAGGGTGAGTLVDLAATDLGIGSATAGVTGTGAGVSGTVAGITTGSVGAGAVTGTQAATQAAAQPSLMDQIKAGAEVAKPYAQAASSLAPLAGSLYGANAQIDAANAMRDQAQAANALAGSLVAPTAPPVPGSTDSPASVAARQQGSTLAQLLYRRNQQGLSSQGTRLTGPGGVNPALVNSRANTLLGL